MTSAVILINWIILWYLVVLTFGYLVLLVVSLPGIFNRYKETEIINLSSLMKSNIMPHITTIIPAYNEEENIIDTIYSVLRSSYTNIDVIVVNDGSTDKTLQKLIETFDLIQIAPFVQGTIKTHGKINGYYVSRFLLNVTVIDKEHTWRSDTLNVGVNACRTDLCMTLDADTILEEQTISRVMFAMLIQPNTVSIGGGLYILNGRTCQDGEITDGKMPSNPIYGFQACEFMRSFLFCRTGWNVFGGGLSYSGAFTCFQTDVLVKLGGFEAYNLAQDFEIITHLQAYIRENQLPHVIAFTPASVAFTDVPGTLKSYWQQRFNWQYWTLHSLFRHVRMLFNPTYGIIGFITYPFFLFGEIFGPVVEFIAYFMIILSGYLGILDVHWTILILVLCWGFITFLTMATALINFLTFKKYARTTDLLLMLFYIVVENFGFHQFSVICRTWATLCYFVDKLKFWNYRETEQNLT